MTIKVSNLNPKRLNPKLYFPSPIQLSESLDPVRDNQYALTLNSYAKGFRA